MQIKFDKKVHRREVWIVDIGNEGIGSEQNGRRPAVIIQNDIGNEFSPTVIVAMVTAQLKKYMPTHMSITLSEPSTVMGEQIRTIDKVRLLRRVYTLTEEEMEIFDMKLHVSLGLK